MESRNDANALAASLLAASNTVLISHPPWRLEVALAHVADGSGTRADIARWWLVQGHCGAVATGLDRILAHLHQKGALAYCPERRGFTVDPLWREIERTALSSVHREDLDAVRRGAAVLDALEAGHDAGFRQLARDS